MVKRAEVSKIVVINGPNLGRLGVREPEIYGSATLEDLRAACTQWGQELGIDVEVRQSDSEAEVYAWLFENQKRIGVIKYVSEREVKEKEKEQAKIEAANNTNLLPADPDAPIEMSDETRARLRIGLSALALNFAKRA